jgi:UDP-glucuronate 4-epimerase
MLSSDSRILITGAAGFIGSHLVEHIAQSTKATIIGVDNFNDYYSPRLKRTNEIELRALRNFNMVEGDFCSAEFVEALFDRYKFSHVLHLGASAGVRFSVDNPHVYFHTNVDGTLSLLEAVRRHSVDRFIFISSSTVYGKDCESPFREGGRLGTPTSPYGASKRAAELLCETYHFLHAVPVVILRLFSVFGPRLRPDLAMSIFAECFNNNRQIVVYGDGTLQRDFTHVSDICRGIIAALEAPAAVGECINLGHDCPVAINDLLHTMQNAFGRGTPIVYHPARLEDLPVTHADLSKARTILNFRPKISFSEGVSDFVRWYTSVPSDSRTD